MYSRTKADAPETSQHKQLESLVSVAIGKDQSWLRNVCIMHQTGKLAQVVKEMDRYRMEAIKMSEAR